MKCTGLKAVSYSDARHLIKGDTAQTSTTPLLILYGVMRCNFKQMTTEQAKNEYQKLFGNVNEQHGFSLTAKKVKSGILVMKWYKRNSWVDPELEKKVLFSNGKVFENHKQVGTYCCA